ncbi:protein Cep78 homolog [Tribolium madens]|uniref:protein Cep78 homolog n=1 Tax=Tribolium madens TaxID=41895 RepID=UPI001CF71F20|nr:protein Cep78 homolog [Tribolium madens]
MPYQKNPSIISNPKPVNIFYVWYTELCRRLNSTPAPVVKPAKPKCQTVLNFVADRLKVEEWSPVINALRHDTSLHVIAIKSRLGNCQFLHDVDTEEKLRQMKRRSGSLWTAFILKSLLKSLSCTIRNTQVLTCLEFDGLPMFAQYLEPLMKALQKNKTLKNLSLSRCRICDSGCQIVCAYVRFAPNIEVLNLSGCGLTSESGEHLAKLIKYQQINRYCESWHNSLRYSDPNIQVMRGIKRITLNGNPLIGDNGLNFILNELDDDLWIKALDMQKCGITENMGLRIIDLVEYSQSLEIADFRLNEDLTDLTLEKILNILKQKYVEGQSEYQWCNTSLSTACESFIDTMSTFTSTKTPQLYKAKSAPFRRYESKVTITERPVRRAKTSENIHNQTKQENVINEKKVMELSNLLKEEILKRKETEKINEELKRRLDEFSKGVQGKTNVDVIDNVVLKYKESGPAEMLNQICRKNGVRKKNGYKNGATTNGYRDDNGYNFNNDVAYTIFEKLVGKDNRDEKSLDEDSLLDYVREEKTEKDDNRKQRNDCDMTDSQISLFKFMENLKNNHNLPMKFMNRSNTSRYYIHVKKKV